MLNPHPFITSMCHKLQQPFHHLLFCYKKTPSSHSSFMKCFYAPIPHSSLTTSTLNWCHMVSLLLVSALWRWWSSDCEVDGGRGRSFGAYMRWVRSNIHWQCIKRVNYTLWVLLIFIIEIHVRDVEQWISRIPVLRIPNGNASYITGWMSHW